MSGRILVTGARGTVGAPLVGALVTAGAPVTAAVTSGEPVPDPGGGDLRTARFDFADAATWEPALDGVDRLFLMRPPRLTQVAELMSPFVRLAVDRGVRQVVVLSVLGVNPGVPHYRMEKDVVATGVPHTLLRPSFFHQNLRTAYRDDIRLHDRLRFPAGGGRTSWVDTRDIADVAALALCEPEAHAGKAYPLTGEEALDWDQVAALLAAELGRPVRYERVGPLRYRRELLDAGTDPYLVRLQLAIHTVARLGLAKKTTSTVRDLLRRAPRTLATYIRDDRSVWER